jgi:vitamin B12 transporter
MKPHYMAGLVSLAALGTHAQVPPLPQLKQGSEQVVVTATRGLQAVASLRDTVVITREDLDNAGSLSLGEVLQRRAGVELRASGGPGQPQGIFIRGAGAAQTLVLVDGLRVGSATAGTTSIENIPLDMIERIEIVKGPMSSLYGSEAAGGVIQIFTRGKSVPYFFAGVGYGTDSDRRASAGLSTSDDTTLVAISMGARKVDAPSATNPRNTFSYVPDRDPHENAFATVRITQKLWQGETLALEAFGSRARTRFDAGDPFVDDRSDQTISGVRFSSSSQFMPWWASRLTLGQGRDKLVFHGQFPSQFETRQDQASWINEFATPGGSTVLGAETVRQSVKPDRRIVNGTGEEVILYSHARRNINSFFASVNQDLEGQRFEASARRDDDEQFGKRNTGSVSYGAEWPSVAQLALTFARGFRAPTFNDLYLVEFVPFYTPNPDLRPERSHSRELSLRAPSRAPTQWRITAFDNQFEDLIVATAQSVLNVNRARIRGVEASIEHTWLGVRWRAMATVQRPRDEESGYRLQSRAERFGSIDASRTYGNWTLGATVLASGDRYDSALQAPASRLPGYALVDARVRYNLTKQWSAGLTATNLADRRYESTRGYDAPRRSVFLDLRFQSY